MNSKILVGFFILVLGAGVGWYALNNNKALVPVTSNTDSTPTVEATPTVDSSVPTAVVSQTGTMTGQGKGAVSTDTQNSVSVSYTDSGFMPKSMTVKKGTKVTFTNNSTKSMWVASDVHPTHQLLPGFDELKSVQAGGTYTYEFAKVGTWTFHNHVNPSDIGSVVVTQ